MFFFHHVHTMYLYMYMYVGTCVCRLVVVCTIECTVHVVADTPCMERMDTTMEMRVEASWCGKVSLIQLSAHTCVLNGEGEGKEKGK